jgi:hypothetical protein
MGTSFQFPASSFQFPASSFQFPVSSFQLQLAGFEQALRKWDSPGRFDEKTGGSVGPNDFRAPHSQFNAG